MKKRLLSCLVAMVLLVCTASCFAESNYDKKLTIEGAWTLYYGVDPNGDALGQWWNDKYNVEWELTSSDDEKVRIWLNSGDAPDVFVWNGDLNEAANYTDQGMLYRFPDDWKERWPNVANVYSYTGYGEYAEERFGGTYMIPRAIFTTAIDVQPILWHYTLWMRKDWMDAVGFEVKDAYTTSEIMDYARLLKEKDPGNVGANLVPISANTTEAYRLFIRANYEKADKFYKDETGKYRWGAADPATLEALKLYQQAYREGLLNPEFFSYQGSESRDAYCVQGISGAIAAGTTASLRQSRTSQIVSNVGITEDDIHRAIFLGNDGKYHDYQVENYGSVVSFSPDISEEKFERIMDMMDFSCTEEGQLLIHCGFEGVDWERNENGEIVSLDSRPMKEKYPSQDPLYCNLCTMADNFGIINPTIPEKYRQETIADYEKKAELSDDSTVYYIDWDLKGHNSTAMQQATFNYNSEFAQLIVKDGDLEQNWKEWVESKMPLVQRLLDELNAE